MSFTAGEGEVMAIHFISTLTSFNHKDAHRTPSATIDSHVQTAMSNDCYSGANGNEQQIETCQQPEFYERSAIRTEQSKHTPIHTFYLKFEQKRRFPHFLFFFRAVEIRLLLHHIHTDANTAKAAHIPRL